MPVSDWFDEFQLKLIRRCVRDDWPKPGTEAGDEYWEGFKAMLVRNGVDADSASEATAQLAEEMPAFRSEVIPKFKAIATAIMARRRAGEGADNKKPEPCDWCEGTGWATTILADGNAWTLTTKGGEVRTVETRVMACICRAGRRCRESAKDAPDLARYLARRLVLPHWAPVDMKAARELVDRTPGSRVEDHPAANARAF